MTINLRKNISKIVKMLVLLLIIFSLTLINMNEKEEKSRLTSTQGLSNKKVGWGIKRNDNHEQPDLGKSNIEVLEKNKGIAMGNKENKYIYLTFDEGYEAGYTHYVNTQPDLVKQMIDEGHIVGNHIPKFLMSLNYKIIKC